MTSSVAHDYAETGLNIRQAMLDHVSRYPDKTKRPETILWRGLHVKTSDWFTAPEMGVVEATFLSGEAAVEQGFDMKVDGWIELGRGEHVPILRTWWNDKFENRVKYPFLSRDGRLFVWNVYKMKYPSGQVLEEKWTGNAGFWVERVSDRERIYHCSHGMSMVPDFESLVFQVRITAL